jgi:hypothetical protein
MIDEEVAIAKGTNLCHFLNLAWAKFHKIIVCVDPFIDGREANNFGEREGCGNVEVSTD